MWFLPYFIVVPVAGLEPARCCQRQILSLLRLPIPPFRQNDTYVRHQRLVV